MSRIDAAVDRAESAYDWVDSRLDLDDANDFLGKAFPAEDSFLLGEVALFCFGILVSTGTFLAFFYEPSTAAVEYGGSVAQYQGQEMPAAFKSVLNITYDVPFGMFLRRMHHWAAHLFVASIALHMLRVFFTGAYRNPREPNWLVGTGLAGLAMFAAYTGYSLPYDEFASTAVGIGYNVAASIRSSATRSRASSSAGSSRRARRSRGCSSSTSSSFRPRSRGSSPSTWPSSSGRNTPRRSATRTCRRGRGRWYREDGRERRGDRRRRPPDRPRR